MTFSLWMNTMNRCLPRRFPRLTALMLALAAYMALSLPAPVAAQTAPRIPPISPAAKRGVLVVTAPPEVLLNGQPERLAPGARIRGRNNLLVLSASLVGQELLVSYVRDQLGLLHQVWILTEAEAALAVAQP